MRVLFYAQHVLGVGHLYRCLELCSALAEGGHEVLLATGGPAVEAPLPEGVDHLPLPPLAMDPAFQGLYSPQGRDPDQVLAERSQALLAALDRARPEILLVEFYPFGRKRFSVEIEPLVAAARTRGGKAVLSLRDILVEKDDQAAFEARAVAKTNALYDLVLVHSDPAFMPLDRTFSRVADLAPPLAYTGYVTPAVAPGTGVALRQRLGLEAGELVVVASAGGGAVGARLCHAVAGASRLLAKTTPHRLYLFTGPHLPEEDYAVLELGFEVMDWAGLDRFARDFPAWLAMADLSVSMAGYNTAMNLLSAGTYGLVLPFARNREQRLRAEALAERGLVRVLEEAELEDGPLAGLLAEGLVRTGARNGARTGRDSHPAIDLGGATRTRELLEALAGSERETAL